MILNVLSNQIKAKHIFNNVCDINAQSYCHSFRATLYIWMGGRGTGYGENESPGMGKVSTKQTHRGKRIVIQRLLAGWRGFHVSPFTTFRMHFFSEATYETSLKGKSICDPACITKPTTSGKAFFFINSSK